jgi:hypothetical protein
MLPPVFDNGTHFNGISYEMALFSKVRKRQELNMLFIVCNGEGCAF